MLQSERSAIQGYSAGKSSERLTLFRTEVGKQMTRDFLGCYPKGNARSCVGGKLKSIVRLDALRGDGGTLLSGERKAWERPPELLCKYIQ